MRRYSVAEARALLPAVIPVLESLRQSIAELREVQAVVESTASRVRGNGHLDENPFARGEGRQPRMQALEQAIREAALQMDAWGIELKDAERGLIDFYSDRNGETVFLCYLLGEPDIAFWHTLEGGFAGRQPL